MQSIALITFIFTFLFFIPFVMAEPTKAPPLLLNNNVFTQGYEALHDQGFIPYSYKIITVRGLTGLSSLDPSFEIQMNHSGLLLIYDNKPIKQFPYPQENQAHLWSELTKDVIQKSYTLSPLLKKLTEERFYQAIFDSSLSLYDVFSHYNPPNQAKIVTAKRFGYGGIGITFDHKNEEFYVQTIDINSPAQKSGLQIGDKIVSINGILTQNLDNEKVMSLLQGSLHTSLTLELKTLSGKNRTLTIQRDLIEPHTVRLDSESYDHNKIVYFIKISSFKNKTSDEFKKIVSSTIKKNHLNPAALIIDVRNNSGGLIEESLKIISFFIKDGLILSRLNQSHQKKTFYYAQDYNQGKALFKNIPLIILVDGYTASAAEIMAASLQDRGYAVVIGSGTFGKGSIQNSLTLPNQSEIVLTRAHLEMPSGYGLNGLGVLPNLCTSDGFRNNDMILEELDDEKINLLPLLKARYSVPLDDQTQRLKIRNFCPLSDHDSFTRDVQLAKSLGLSPSRYQKALHLMKRN